MARIDIDIEDYLDEVGTYNLISELEDRRLDKESTDRLKAIIQKDGVIGKLNELSSLSLADLMKLEEFLETLKK
jgi:hypothetical protein